MTISSHLCTPTPVYTVREMVRLVIIMHSAIFHNVSCAVTFFEKCRFIQATMQLTLE